MLYHVIVLYMLDTLLFPDPRSSLSPHLDVSVFLLMAGWAPMGLSQARESRKVELRKCSYGGMKLKSLLPWCETVGGVSEEGCLSFVQTRGSRGMSMLYFLNVPCGELFFVQVRRWVNDKSGFVP